MSDYAVPTDDDEQWAMVERAMDETGLTNEQRWWAFVILDESGCAAALNYIEALKRAKEVRRE
jgi:hypothetical protein